MPWPTPEEDCCRERTSSREVRFKLHSMTHGPQRDAIPPCNVLFRLLDRRGMGQDGGGDALAGNNGLSKASRRVEDDGLARPQRPPARLGILLKFEADQVWGNHLGKGNLTRR